MKLAPSSIRPSLFLLTLVGVVTFTGSSAAQDRPRWVAAPAPAPASAPTPPKQTAEDSLARLLGVSITGRSMQDGGTTAIGSQMLAYPDASGALHLVRTGYVSAANLVHLGADDQEAVYVARSIKSGVAPTWQERLRAFEIEGLYGDPAPVTLAQFTYAFDRAFFVVDGKPNFEEASHRAEALATYAKLLAWDAKRRPAPPAPAPAPAATPRPKPRRR